jgi:hypothetical protein
MAFSGLHVVCGYAGGPHPAGLLQMPAFARPVWSETLAAAATTTNVAPVIDANAGPPLFRITVSADSWVSVGPAPNASSGTRFLATAAGGDCDVFVTPGDKLAWILA